MLFFFVPSVVEDFVEMDLIMSQTRISKRNVKPGVGVCQGLESLEQIVVRAHAADRGRIPRVCQCL